MGPAYIVPLVRFVASFFRLLHPHAQDHQIIINRVSPKEAPLLVFTRAFVHRKSGAAHTHTPDVVYIKPLAFAAFGLSIVLARGGKDNF